MSLIQPLYFPLFKHLQQSSKISLSFYLTLIIILSYSQKSIHKMLAIFRKSITNPPEQLKSPSTNHYSQKPKHPQQILSNFITIHPTNTYSTTFSNSTILSYTKSHQTSFTSIDGIFCLFIGHLNNLYAQIKQYGLSKNTNESMFVIEAYRTLRDRGPYPADQVISDLDGSFAFVVYDSKVGTVFTALGSDGGVKLYWGIAGDGSVVISDDLEVIKSGCAKSFAPFPKGCMFHSEGGLMSFEHPMNKIRAMPRVDSEGVMCGANFKVDTCSRVSSIPRRGSEANWTQWDDHC